MTTWQVLTNIWLGKILKKHNFDFSGWQPLVLDYRRLATQCRIRLYQRFGTTEHVTECTVAEAVSQYVKPGQCMLPRESPVASLHAAKRMTAYWLNRFSRQPYRAAISDYVLVNLDTEQVLDRRKKGPQIFLFDILDNRGTHERIMSVAYAALKAGKTTTFSLAPKHSLAPQERSTIEDDSTQRSTVIAASSVSTNQDEPESAIRRSPVLKQSVEDNSLLRSDISQEITHLDDDLQELESRASLLYEDFEDLREEEQDEPQEFSRPVYSQQQTDDQSTGAPSTQESEEASGFVDMVKLRKLQEQTSTSEDNKTAPHWSSSSKAAPIPIGPTFTPSSLDSDDSQPSADVLAVNESDNDIDAAAIAKEATEDWASEREAALPPLVPYSDNLPLELVEIPPEEYLVPTLESSQMLEWSSINMPHLWPDVVQACMPAGCTVALDSCWNGAQIQFVIKPEIGAAVRGMLHDAELRGLDEWL